jgi:hypothetical protein
MGKPSKPTIEEILASLQNEVILGKAYVAIAKGLKTADPVVMQTAQTFFSLTVEASLQVAQMLAAKLFDTHSWAVTVSTLLSAAAGQAGSFRNGNPHHAIANLRTRIARLNPILTSLQKRRNEELAHLDPATVIDPQALSTRAQLTITDLLTVFDEAGTILNEISILYNGMNRIFELFGSDDYQTALKLIADAKNAQADQYEKEFKESWPYPRPRSDTKPIP